MSIQFKDAISKILSKENKDKTFQNVEDEIYDYIVQIKNSLENGDIDYQKLQEEISKHLNKDEETLPGSISQFLIGCMNDNETCPIVKEKEVRFVYDHKRKKVKPLENYYKEIDDDTYAILYVTGNPKRINNDILNYFIKKGFKKIKFKYKPISSNKYQTLSIDNLINYINKNNNNGNEFVLIFGIILILIIFYLMANKKN